ncbi:MAG: GNAT family N-acetyltransferase [Eubacteriales bacterium]|nr:GNAT family N-acetyltransferase [Eubacteriales bacterium]MDD3881939.1 GNAT family N-acetyltransferase [Eubacteriales bacterium]MDD4513820.1 GNAT family N-acetyltransferase [Eubacteriales bacterium]
MEIIEAAGDDTALIKTAGEIHSISWRDSHKAFCTPEFLDLHSPERQTEYISGEIKAGKRLFICLSDGKAVGIVTVFGSMIENLYVLPEYQRKGFGTALLLFAADKCKSSATLWVLENNKEAQALYARKGFLPTGNRNAITETLDEIEMAQIS